MHEIRTATFDMQIWLIDRWTGTPVNAAPDEHDAVAWFETSELDSLPGRRPRRVLRVGIGFLRTGPGPGPARTGPGRCCGGVRR